MEITSFTTFNDIRAVLGVSSDEIEDATLSLDIFELNLTSELEDIGLALVSDYSTVAELTTRTAVQERFYQATRLFSAYAVAFQATGSLPLFSPKDISDGKATVSRYADSPYKEVIKKVTAQYEKFKLKLEKAYADFGSNSAPSRTVLPFFNVASGARDPVTNS